MLTFTSDVGKLNRWLLIIRQSSRMLLPNWKRYSPRHKHWPAGPAHFSDRRTSSGQYILSVTGPYGPPRYISGHQISNSAGPNDDNSQCVFFARSPVPHLGSFRAALLLQRDASVSRVRVWHVNQTHWRQCLDHAALQRDPGRIRALFSAKHMSWFRVNSFAFWSVNLKYWLINLRDRCKGL